MLIGPGVEVDTNDQRTDGSSAFDLRDQPRVRVLGLDQATAQYPFWVVTSLAANYVASGVGVGDGEANPLPVLCCPPQQGEDRAPGSLSVRAASWRGHHVMLAASRASVADELVIVAYTYPGQAWS